MTNRGETAQVIAAHGKRGKLLLTDGSHAGFLLKGRKLKPVCGDVVSWQPAAGDDLILESVQQRRNELRRSGHKGRPDVLAANLDLLCIVIAPQPAPDFFLTDRYIATAIAMDCEPVLIHSKTDIADPQDSGIEKELQNYSALGLQVISTSTRSNRGIDAVATLLSGHTGMLVGQSGVGKSSLINALVPDAEVAVAALSRSSLEGRHTTTASIMHQVGGNGWLIDSPGVRDFLPYFDDVRDVQKGFSEIMQASGNCRFANCQHLREPGCAVKSAVAEGVISERRYDSYKRLYHMAEDAQVGH